MAASLYLAIDLGAESGRVIAGRFDGQKLSLEELHRFSNTPSRANGTMYWDVLRLWNDIQDGLTKAASFGDVAGIGADTWGVDFALLDGAGDMLGNPVHYRDKRHAGYIDRANKVMSREKIYASTGLQFLPFNSLYQLLALKEKQPHLLERTRTLLFMPDLLHFWLSGAKTNEYSIASTTQMLDAKKRFWDVDLIRAFDLPTTILPDLVPPGTVVGNLRPEVSTRTGLKTNTAIIAPAGHDTASAVASVPFENRSKAAYLSSGTWSLMGLELEEPLISERTFELGFTNEGGFDNTIRFLKNIAGLWLVQECRRRFLREGKNFSYAELTTQASQVGDDGPFIEPDDARFAAPENMVTEIQNYCRETNQAVPQSEGEIVRCCLDSLALKYRWTFERLEELRGEPLELLHIVGGGTQNVLLCQLSADAIGKPVIAGPVEGTAAGNILLQGLARGEISGASELREVVRNSFPTQNYEPNAAQKARWDEKFARFAKLPG